MSRLSKSQLLDLLKKLMEPKTSENEGDAVLISFCAGCPDPIGARWLIVECLDQLSDEELVDRALDMPTRKMVDVPFSELPSQHPLRHLAQ
jgi:hypothetical protein